MKKVILALLALALFQSCSSIKLSPIDKEEMQRLQEQHFMLRNIHV